jgi:hypothetical protein
MCGDAFLVEVLHHLPKRPALGPPLEDGSDDGGLRLDYDDLAVHSFIPGW